MWRFWDGVRFGLGGSCDENKNLWRKGGMSDWSAVLIDTNIFIKTNYNFDGGHLERMKSFRHRPEKIIFDDIIYGEIVSNFSKHLFEKSQALKKANKEAWSAKLINLSQKGL